MTTGGRRDLDDVRSGLLAWCAIHRPEVARRGIDDLSHPSAGMSNETVIVRCGPDANGQAGPRFVLRLPPLYPTFPEHDFTAQAAVQDAVARLGVPTARPTVELDTDFLGSPFIVMPFIDGEIPGQQSLFDPWLTGATDAERREAQREMVRMLATIGRLDWRSAGLDTILGEVDGSLEVQVQRWCDYLTWAEGDRALPRVEAVAAWCRDNQPAEGPPASLVWGDPRLGNLVMDESRCIRAVLDWELATIGPAEMDLGWYLGLERVLLEVTGIAPLPGFADFDEVAGDYQRALGRPLRDLAFHEIFAVFRALAINVRQSHIAYDAGEKYMIAAGEKNPLLPILEKWISAYDAGQAPYAAELP
ncbi:MAG: phosphotransferase family protein [Actinomycetota bacterium]|nr:phosphotransferase family protein [Actinomycetota bacterium]